jgi:hypothetical protein
MERIRNLGQRKQSYEPLDNDSGFSESESRPLTLADEDEEGHDLHSGHDEDVEEGAEFSWVTYAVFLLLGMAMLWAW